MSLFEQISNDQYIINLYSNISKSENLKGGWANHDYVHVTNVANTVETILRQLGYDENIIEESNIACILHDMGCLQGKDNHAIRSYEMAKEYLENNNINLENHEKVLDAIKNHSSGFNTDNIIAISLIFADKLDIKRDRLAKAGYEIEGLKEIKYIEDITVNIDNKNLVVKFVSDNDIDKEALEKFYFIPKVFKAIYSFSNKVNLEPIILFNGEEWRIDI